MSERSWPHRIPDDSPESTEKGLSRLAKAAVRAQYDSPRFRHRQGLPNGEQRAELHAGC